MKVAPFCICHPWLHLASMQEIPIQFKIDLAVDDPK